MTWKDANTDFPKKADLYLGARWRDSLDDWELLLVRFDPEWIDRWQYEIDLWVAIEIPNFPEPPRQK